MEGVDNQSGTVQTIAEIASEDPDGYLLPEREIPELEAVDSLPAMDGDSLWQALSSQIPKVVKSDLPEQKETSEQQINKMNMAAQTSLLEILSQNEQERLKQQNPLRTWLLILVSGQMVAFNVIMGYMVYRVCSNLTSEIIADILDFFKYFIGAVLVELIGMVWFITKSTFTSTARDIVKGLFDRLSKQK